MGEWRPCPFCPGAGRTAWRMGDRWAVQCDNCLAYGPPAETEAGAIRNWNERRLD